MAFDGWIGRGGLGKECEGDGRTPVGNFQIPYAFGLRENPGTELPYVRVTKDHYFVDDPASRYYNQLVRASRVDRDWKSAEHLSEMGAAYAYAMVLDYNRERIPGLGSGIFLHCHEGHPTAGCVAVEEGAMVRILRANADRIEIRLP